MKQRSGIVYGHYPMLSQYRAAHSFALTAHAQLFSRKESDVLCLSGQEQVIVAEGNGRGVLLHGEIAGVVVFEMDEEDGYAWVSLAYVAAHCRNEGVLRSLMEELHTHVSKMGDRGIHVGVVAGNLGAIQAYEKLGGKLYSQQFRWEVK